MLKEIENLIPFPSCFLPLTIDLNRFSSALLSHEEVKNLLRFFREKNHIHYMIVKFLLSTGASIPDLIHFKSKDIDFHASTFTMHGGKRLNYRQIGVEKGFLQEVYRYASGSCADAPLFEGRGGCSRDERSIQKILYNASVFLRKEINIPVIRDSITLYLHQNGVSLREIQNFLGHRSMKSTRQRISGSQMRMERQKRHNFDVWKEKAA